MTYKQSSICAPRGSTLEISAVYQSYFGKPTSTSWFRTEHGPQARRQSAGLKETLQSDAHVEISPNIEGSTLRIRNLTESHSAEYQFTFQTDSFTWTSVLPGTRVTVTGTDQQRHSPFTPLVRPQQPVSSLLLHPGLVCSSAGSADQSG